MMKNRDFINIKTIDISRLDETFKICFTYTIQADLKISYKNNKGRNVKVFYRKAPFKAQKEYLTRGITELKDCAYYFEQHKDNRYHIHAFCIEKLRNFLYYINDRYEECKLESQKDLQDFCLLSEIVACPPSWVAYCHKEQEQHKRDIFVSEIEEYVNNKLDDGIVKIETNNTLNTHPDYKFGKKFFVEL